MAAPRLWRLLYLLAAALSALAGASAPEADGACGAGHDEMACVSLLQARQADVAHRGLGRPPGVEREADLAEVLRGVAEGRAEPLEVRKLLPRLVAVMRSKAPGVSKQKLETVVTSVVDSNGDGLLDREELRLALGMTEAVAEGEAETELVPYTGPIPMNVSLAQMGKQGTTGYSWEESSCCDGFNYYILEGAWFTPKFNLADTIGDPYTCYILMHLPGQNCNMHFFYANSGEPAPYGGLCRCTSASNDWADLSLWVSTSGSSIYWPKR
mmetsp:Transcript_38784/g.97477  ORF Transcript_38784/g.97477 Transcript_38784/m.97477 type:complete len:269 (+) Transcript_38784:101-907(+)